MPTVMELRATCRKYGLLPEWRVGGRESVKQYLSKEALERQVVLLKQRDETSVAMKCEYRFRPSTPEDIHMFWDCPSALEEGALAPVELPVQCLECMPNWATLPLVDILWCL
jgi:hypothetical protein